MNSGGRNLAVRWQDRVCGERLYCAEAKRAKNTFEGVSKECSVRKEERCGGWEGETCAGASGCVVRYAGAEKRFMK